MAQSLLDCAMLLVTQLVEARVCVCKDNDMTTWLIISKKSNNT